VHFAVPGPLVLPLGRSDRRAQLLADRQVAVVARYAADDVGHCAVGRVHPVYRTMVVQHAVLDVHRAPVPHSTVVVGAPLVLHIGLRPRSAAIPRAVKLVTVFRFVEAREVFVRRSRNSTPTRALIRGVPAAILVSSPFLFLRPGISLSDR